MASRTLVAYALIWTLFASVPAARAVLLKEFRRFPAAVRGRFWMGLACGFVLVLLDAVIHVLGRAYSYAPTPIETLGLVVTLGWVILVACTEEMMVRGLLLTRLREVAGNIVAVASTALLFAVMHVGRLDFSMATATQYFADGVFLGAITILTGDIWSATGFHLAKNLWTSLAFGASHQFVPPLLAPRAGGIDTNVADLLAYVTVLPVSLLVFSLPKRRRRTDNSD